MEKKTIDPMLMMDKAIDMSMKLAGTEFPVSIFPSRIQRIIREVHECHSYPTDYIAARNREHASCSNQTRLARKSYPLHGTDRQTGSE